MEIEILFGLNEHIVDEKSSINLDEHKKRLDKVVDRINSEIPPVLEKCGGTHYFEVFSDNSQKITKNDLETISEKIRNIYSKKNLDTCVCNKMPEFVIVFPYRKYDGLIKAMSDPYIEL